MITTTSQKILNFLCHHPSEQFFSSQIAIQTQLSKGGVNQILRKMAQDGLLLTQKKGRMIFYSVDTRSSFVRQFKILNNVAFAENLVKYVKPLAERIVLFGSCAKGEDAQDSDVDLHIVTNDKEKVRSLLLKGKASQKIQAVIHTPVEYMALSIKEPVFAGELNKGIVLWQKE